MNFELVPCCIKDCDEPGKLAVEIGYQRLLMCTTHALEVAERAQAEGTFRGPEGDDDED